MIFLPLNLFKSFRKPKHSIKGFSSMFTQSLPHIVELQVFGWLKLSFIVQIVDHSNLSSYVLIQPEQSLLDVSSLLSFHEIFDWFWKLFLLILFNIFILFDLDYEIIQRFFKLINQHLFQFVKLFDSQVFEIWAFVELQFFTDFLFDNFD